MSTDRFMGNGRIASKPQQPFQHYGSSPLSQISPFATIRPHSLEISRAASGFRITSPAHLARSRITMTDPIFPDIDRAIAISAQSYFTCPFPPEIEPRPIQGLQLSSSSAYAVAPRSDSSTKEAQDTQELQDGPNNLKDYEEEEEEFSLEDVDEYSLDDSDIVLSNSGVKADLDWSDHHDQKKKSSKANSDSNMSVKRRNSRCKSKKWQERFEDLKAFKKKHGHCKVTYQNNDNDPDLVQWLKRQRYHFKLRSLGKSTPLLDSQIKRLDSIGFVWNSHGTAWDEKMSFLEDFYREHGHCRVPRDYDENPPLSTWVKRQRRLYKAGKVSPPRVARLEAMGFEWDPRGLHKKVPKKMNKA